MLTSNIKEQLRLSALLPIHLVDNSGASVKAFRSMAEAAGATPRITTEQAADIVYSILNNSEKHFMPDSRAVDAAGSSADTTPVVAEESTAETGSAEAGGAAGAEQQQTQLGEGADKKSPSAAKKEAWIAGFSSAVSVLFEDETDKASLKVTAATIENLFGSELPNDKAIKLGKSLC